MARISVVGVSGAGKTTLAARVGRTFGVAHLELDAVYHQADWTPLPDDDFRARVRVFLDEHEHWVICGNYSMVQDLVWEAATDVVVLDPPRRRVMRRLGRRTLGRTLGRTELWNGNREPWSNLWSRDPERSILAWAWTQHREYRERYRAAAEDPAWEHLRFWFVRSRADEAGVVDRLAVAGR